MICAKTFAAMSWLQKQFAQRKVKKTYVAVVGGVPEPPEAIIDMPIGGPKKRPQTFRVGNHGKSATTTYKVHKTGNGLSLVELKPTTGRTHRLRVRLQHVGHPIVGDSFYHGPAAAREAPFLHAQSLEITLPNHQRQIFTVPTPPEFKELIKP